MDLSAMSSTLMLSGSESLSDASQLADAAGPDTGVRLESVIEQVVNLAKWASSRRRPLLWLLFFVALAYAVHEPLPESFAERHLMHVVDAVLRITYHRPARFMPWLGLTPQHQVLWTRYVLDSFARLLAPWSSKDEHVDIYDTEIAGVPVRVYTPHDHVGRANDGALIYVHGGGFVLGEVAGYEDLLRVVAARLRMVVLSVEYRLAPEHPYPAAIDDVEAVVVAVLSHTWRALGVDPTRVVLAGDSAGGNLVAGTTLRVRELRERQRRALVRPLPEIKGQILLYPLVQFHDMQLPSYQQYWREYSQTSFLDPEAIARAYLMYLGAEPTADAVEAIVNNAHTGADELNRLAHRLSHDHLPAEYRASATRASLPTHGKGEYPPPSARRHPRLASHVMANEDAAPLLASSLHDLPRALVLTCEYDVLRDEGFLYARALKEAGVTVDYDHYEGGFHAMLNFWRQIPHAQRMIDDWVSWVDRHI